MRRCEFLIRAGQGLAIGGRSVHAMLVPAIANATYALTGQRLRRLPLRLT